MIVDFTKKWQGLRPLGPLEQYLAVQHELEFYTNVAVTATYYLPHQATTRSLKNDVYRACEMLIEQHPILSVNIVTEGNNTPYFVRLPVIDLDQCITFQTRQKKQTSDRFPRDIEIERLLQAQHNTFFEQAGAPLWQLLCVLENPSDRRTFTAAFIYHHVIGDGGSGKAFHATFAQALERILEEPLRQPPQFQNSKERRGRARRFVIPPTSPLLPSLEEVMDLPLCNSFLMKAFLKTKFARRRDLRLWVGTTEEICGPLMNRVRYIALSTAITDALRKACAINGTSITALLEVLISRSLFKHVDSSYTRINCQGNISARRWISPESVITEGSIGTWILGYTQQYKRRRLEGSLFPWHEARKAKRSIKKNLAQRDRNRSVGLLRLVSGFTNDILLSHVGKPRQVSLEISNLGVFENKSSSSVKIGRMVFSQSANIAGSAITVSAITGGDGCLVLAFTWQDGVVEADLIQSSMIDVEKQIVELVR